MKNANSEFNVEAETEELRHKYVTRDTEMFGVDESQENLFKRIEAMCRKVGWLEESENAWMKRREQRAFRIFRQSPLNATVASIWDEVDRNCPRRGQSDLATQLLAKASSSKPPLIDVYRYFNLNQLLCLGW